MADSPDTPQMGQTVSIRVLSQLSAPHGTILLEPLASIVTIAEVKQKLQSLLPSNPAPDRQRLIYQGRPLARDTDTLVTVFGEDVVRQGELQTLHLVVRELTSQGIRPQPIQPPNQQPANIPLPRPISVAHVPFPTARPAVARPTGVGVLHQTPFDVNARQQAVGVVQVQHAANAAVHQLNLLQIQMQQIQQQLASLRPQGLPQAAPQGVPLNVLPNQLPNIQQINRLAHHQRVAQHTQHINQLVGLNQNGMRPNAPLNAIQRVPLPMDQMFQEHIQRLQQANRPDGGPQPAPAQPMGRTTDITSTGHANLGEGTNSSADAPALEQQHAPADGQPEVQTHTADVETSQGSAQTQSATPNQSVAGNSQSVTQHGVGPDGERWTVTINNSAMPFPPQPGLPNFLQHMQLPGFAPIPGIGGPQVLPRPQSPSQFAWLGPTYAVDRMRGHQDELDAAHEQYRRTLMGGRPLSEGVRRSTLTIIDSMVQNRNIMQTSINNVLAHGVPPGHTGLSSQDVITLQTMRDQFRGDVQRIVQELQNAPNSSNEANAAAPTESVSNAAAGGQSYEADASIRASAPNPDTLAQSAQSASVAGPSTQSTPSSAPLANERRVTTSNVVAYLLSSPTGPHAIIYTPQGVFSTPTAPGVPLNTGAHPSQLNITRSRSERGVRPAQDQAANENANNAINDQAGRAAPAWQRQLALMQPFMDPLAPPPLGGQAPVQAQAQAQAAGQAQHENPLVIALTPFFRTLWFSIRLLAFFWLFLGVGEGSTRRMILVMIASAIYHAYQIGVFRQQIEWALRHWEGLIGTPRPREQGGEGAQTGTATQHLQRGNLQPEEAARRLVEQRREQSRGWLRARLRSVERAVALFVASLWPGVGERHVAERERMQREADERNRGTAAAVATAAAAPDTSSASAQPDNQAQPPPAAADDDTEELFTVASTSGTQAKGVTAGGEETHPTDTASSSAVDSAAEGTSSSVAVREDERTLTARRMGTEE